MGNTYLVAYRPLESSPPLARDQAAVAKVFHGDYLRGLKSDPVVQRDAECAMRSLKAIAKLEHPNVLPLFMSEPIADNHLTMTPLQAGTLRQAVPARRLSQRRRVELLIQALRGLARFTRPASSTATSPAQHPGRRGDGRTRTSSTSTSRWPSRTSWSARATRAYQGRHLRLARLLGGARDARRRADGRRSRRARRLRGRRRRCSRCSPTSCPTARPRTCGSSCSGSTRGGVRRQEPDRLPGRGAARAAADDRALPGARPGPPLRRRQSRSSASSRRCVPELAPARPRRRPPRPQDHPLGDRTRGVSAVLQARADPSVTPRRWSR